eukprot:1472643-Pyramimonas_sp.AAC.1
MADEVLKAEQLIETIQAEGKEKNQSIFDAILEADTDVLHPSEIEFSALGEHFKYDKDMGAEGRAAVDNAKQESSFGEAQEAGAHVQKAAGGAYAEGETQAEES